MARGSCVPLADCRPSVAPSSEQPRVCSLQMKRRLCSEMPRWKPLTLISGFELEMRAAVICQGKGIHHSTLSRPCSESLDTMEGCRLSHAKTALCKLRSLRGTMCHVCPAGAALEALEHASRTIGLGLAVNFAPVCVLSLAHDLCPEFASVAQ